MIKLLITGGTIDKRYNETNGELILSNSTVPDILKQGRVTTEISIETLMLKDSLHFDDIDRLKIIETCLNCKEDQIIITHGTDTLIDTSKEIANNINNKTIVLLGAIVPFVFKKSDALFNLGSAISAVQTLEHGIYITMNGKIFCHDNVVKNIKTGEFQNLNR
jgi:L-asparaginase